MVGSRRFPCAAHFGHGERNLVGAIRDSCNVFFYKYGIETGADLMAAEARRFGFGHPTGIELPSGSITATSSPGRITPRRRRPMTRRPT